MNKNAPLGTVLREDYKAVKREWRRGLERVVDERDKARTERDAWREGHAAWGELEAVKAERDEALAERDERDDRLADDPAMQRVVVEAQELRMRLSEALAALRQLVYGVKNHGFGGDTTYQKARANAESFLSNQEKPE